MRSLHVINEQDRDCRSCRHLRHEYDAAAHQDEWLCEMAEDPGDDADGYCAGYELASYE